LAIDSFLIVNGFRVQKMQNNLYVGDIILTLNSRPIQLYYDSLKQYISASNDASLKRDVGHYIFRTNKKFNKLTLVRNRDTLNIEDEFYEESVLWDQYISERRSFARQNVGKIIEDGIGYIKLDQIFDNNLDMSLDWMFSSTSAVILDLRGHPNDTYEEVIKKFFNGDGYFWKFIYPDIDFPGAFRLNEKPSKIKAKNNQEIYKGQLIILVDENTQSHAEFSVMAFQLVPKIKIIGTQTAGADGNISVINLPGGINTSFSGIGIFYPDMKKTQRIGIIPDIYVNRTLKGAIEGKDEILDAAILYIKTL
jgi:carboxyl-terminal processing protease